MHFGGHTHIHGTPKLSEEEVGGSGSVGSKFGPLNTCAKREQEHTPTHTACLHFHHAMRIIARASRRGTKRGREAAAAAVQQALVQGERAAKTIRRYAASALVSTQHLADMGEEEEGWAWPKKELQERLEAAENALGLRSDIVAQVAALRKHVETQVEAATATAAAEAAVATALRKLKVAEGAQAEADAAVRRARHGLGALVDEAEARGFLEPGGVSAAAAAAAEGGSSSSSAGESSDGAAAAIAAAIAGAEGGSSSSSSSSGESSEGEGSDDESCGNSGMAE